MAHALDRVRVFSIRVGKDSSYLLDRGHDSLAREAPVGPSLVPGCLPFFYFCVKSIWVEYLASGVG